MPAAAAVTTEQRWATRQEGSWHQVTYTRWDEGLRGSKSKRSRRTWPGAGVTKEDGLPPTEQAGRSVPRGVDRERKGPGERQKQKPEVLGTREPVRVLLGVHRMRQNPRVRLGGHR